MSQSAARAVQGRHPAHEPGRYARGASQVFRDPSPVLRSPSSSSFLRQPSSLLVSRILRPVSRRIKNQEPRTKNKEPRTLHLSGFTLVELLAVIAIIGILVSIVAGAIQSVVYNRKVAQAKSEVQAIAAAAEEYYRTFREVPLSTNWYVPVNPPFGDQSDCYFAPGNAQISVENPPTTGSPYQNTTRPDNYAMANELYNILTGSNSLGKSFLALQRVAGVNSTNGVLLDPWQRPYEFWLDSDYSGRISFQRFATNVWSTTIEKNCIIFVRSKGPNGKVDAYQSFQYVIVNPPYGDDLTWPPVETL